MNTMIILVLIFLFFFLLFFMVVSSAARGRKKNKRIKNFIPKKHEEMDMNKEQEERVIFSKKIIGLLSRFFRKLHFSKKTEKKLEQAGSALNAEDFFVFRIVAGFAFGLTANLLGIHWFFSILIGFCGLVIPDSYMAKKRKKRLNLLTYQLVETLGTMANSMRAGFSFMQAMQLVAKEMPDPIGPEFDRVVREANLGVPLDDVFKDLLIRLPNKELEVVVQGLLAQRQSGGNVVQLLETMEETIRGRIRVLDELRTLTSQGKMSSWIITLLPVVLAIYMYFASPDYFGPMLDHPLGILTLCFSGLFIIIGWFVIQKIIQIEV
ncbi:hypothetical protein GH741_16800 [Aquibacillus halophilus]|uniref:Type II secretion system protein GspF domain-containing protein n=1 Tax=Aquibacillus halophilus TaxID=930132 RepID=A0A6A8DFB7_9BACI|nr:type II secretion system F family protein [Aquibacillus halophilus]MRH44304.1 hypothetical protein [Aquibacillus halophilus]